MGRTAAEGSAGEDMSDMKTQITIDLHKHAARTFVALKGRMPSDKYELQAWLMEFTEEMGKILRHYSDSIARFNALVYEKPAPLVIPYSPQNSTDGKGKV